MTTFGTVIQDALRALKPELAEQYKALVQSVYRKAVEYFGLGMDGLWDAWRRYGTNSHQNSISQTFRHVVQKLSDAKDHGPYTDEAGKWHAQRFEYNLNEERLAKAAERAAEATAMAWEKKISGKLGELDEAQVSYLSGGSFRITGKRGGKAILIEQQTILKVSSRGKLFNQFPARIYVDGKFTPEAAYKRLAV